MAQVRGLGLVVNMSETMETQKNLSYEEKIMEQNNDITSLLKDIKEYIAIMTFNFVKTYPLTSTAIKRLQFHNDTGNAPIRKIIVENIGGGLTLWINGNEGISVGATKTFDNIEINSLDYQVTSGTAHITIYTRI